MTASISSAGLTGPETSASEQSRMELQAKLNGLGGLNGRHMSAEAKAKKLREACDGFESIFIQKMWQEMRNAIPKTGLLTGREERFWQDMYDQELSKSMTKAGGIGLADMMYEQLSQNLASVSRATAGAPVGSPFTPAAAPMVTNEQAQDLIDPAPPKTASVASIYESEAPQARQIADNTVTAQQSSPQPLTAATSIQTQPLPRQKLAQVHYSPAANTAYENNFSADRVENDSVPRHKGSDFNEPQGLLMAQQARRDAGDKLSSRAVRPASPRARKQREDRQTRMQAKQQELLAQMQAAQAAQQRSVISQNGMRPGSPDALRAAMSMAKTGLPDQDTNQAAIDLHNLVADVQARNAAMQSALAPQPPENTEPQVRRVRKSTNIPQNNNNRNIKKNSQAIRMLNVDNVGVNSRQGQGLAAYHAAQQQGAAAAASPQPTQIVANQATPGAPIAPMVGNPQAMTPVVTPLPDSRQATPPTVPPLTAASQNASQNQTPTGNFAIPPLTATHS